MAEDPAPASEASLAALLGSLLNDTKALFGHELTLAKLEVRQEVRKTKKVLLALGGGVGAAVAGGLLLIGLVVYLLETVTGLPLWGCYGLVGGVFILGSGVLLAKGKAQAEAIDVVPSQTVETLKENVRGLTGQPTAEPQLGRRPSPQPQHVRQRGGGAPSLNGKALWELFTAAFTQWSRDKPFELGAALAYYTLFSLAPILIIAIAIAGLAFGQEAAQNQIVSTLQGMVGPESAQAIQALVQKASRPGSGVLATLIGMVTLAIGAGGVVGQLQDSLNTIWGVEPKPGRGLLGLLRDRFVSFGLHYFRGERLQHIPLARRVLLEPHDRCKRLHLRDLHAPPQEWEQGVL